MFLLVFILPFYLKSVHIIDISTSCIYSSFVKDVKSVYIRDISLVQDHGYALGKAHMRSIPSLILISFRNAAFETVRLTDCNGVEL